ncbi:MAG: hypothetical protein EZS28_021691, partial [Streblomastix strix]
MMLQPNQISELITLMAKQNNNNNNNNTGIQNVDTNAASNGVDTNNINQLSQLFGFDLNLNLTDDQYNNNEDIDNEYDDDEQEDDDEHQYYENPFVYSTKTKGRI